ncbi:hypothetical protein ACFQQB_50665 [Nonomuraea rubra]|uniref:hypothetical protein n=1 Tax=Nonomuraea rubra TaxID=46180 RepID=UPI00360D6C08
MTTTAAVTTGERASVREDLVTVLCGTIMISGLAIDGWAHKNVIDTLEGFFTPTTLSSTWVTA